MRLNRIVAIKLIKSELTQDPEARQRFEREARAISSLNHPHICSLFDVGNHNGIEYLVMEFLEGETFGKRLTMGPLPFAQALAYAIQIAGALEQAHQVGLVHRDLKPANIMITKSGVKLLDFGLAKIATCSEDSVTETLDLTAAGAIIGTPRYMAPEQVRGKTADKRTDIFAFGTVLYEMLSGRKAFPGSTQASVAAAILEGEPGFPIFPDSRAGTGSPRKDLSRKRSCGLLPIDARHPARARVC